MYLTERTKLVNKGGVDQDGHEDHTWNHNTGEGVAVPGIIPSLDGGTGKCVITMTNKYRRADNRHGSCVKSIISISNPRLACPVHIHTEYNHNGEDSKPTGIDTKDRHGITRKTISGTKRQDTHRLSEKLGG